MVDVYAEKKRIDSSCREEVIYYLIVESTTTIGSQAATILGQNIYRVVGDISKNCVQIENDPQSL